MKKRNRGKENASKEELSIQDGDHDLPRLRLLASRNSPGLSFLSFPPTLGLFVVQSRNSRDPWESTWESDSMGPIVFSTDISRRQRGVRELENIIKSHRKKKDEKRYEEETVIQRKLDMISD
ncbi:uncharacterized protein LOC112454858 [Temnothorax curvispinosus]|uniref:Uncharacterized protein LOC112454858 n=1 Tax=Temnothorax curvispinosus TaxID=300111 RepID=A0A6J1PSI4_9HYME|nr:uncharacterized protein LOC112454858 [Temnothorax curvispinosus]